MTNQNPNIITYRRIRKAIGVLGMALPILLILLSCFPFFKTEYQDSISHYYHTNLREIFTGILCSVGLFLFLYEGTRNSNLLKNDKVLTNIAGFMAIGVAFFPTNIEDCSQKVKTLIPLCENNAWIGYVHYGCAAILFFIFGLISINIFTIGQDAESGIDKSIVDENNIYKSCGYVIFASMALSYFCGRYNCFKYSTLIFETIMLFAFGIAWLIKGRALGDKGMVGKMLYRENN